MRRAALLAVLWSAAVLADAVDVSLQPTVMLGKGLPSIVLQIQEPIAGFEVTLTRGDGHPVQVKGGGKPGTRRVVELPQPEGKHTWTGELRVRFKDGSDAAMPLSFETELLGPLRMVVKKEDVDVEARRARFTLSRPAGKARVAVLMDTGRWAMDEEVSFAGEEPGTSLAVEWPPAEGKVLKIAITAYDTSGFYTGVELFPWRVDIPHEEVHFDTGKWFIRPDQRGKLDRSYALISEAVAKYGRFADIKLYVAGHTDSVGPADKNRALSMQRARSIGAYFREKGLRIPIFWEGFGEQALLVQTADEVDEPRNRRTEYIIAVEEPEVRGAPFAPRWRRL